MKLENVIKKHMQSSHMLFSTRFDVLTHFFQTIGNGMYLLDSGMVCDAEDDFVNHETLLSERELIRVVDDWYSSFEYTIDDSMDSTVKNVLRSFNRANALERDSTLQRINDIHNSYLIDPNFEICYEMPFRLSNDSPLFKYVESSYDDVLEQALYYRDCLINFNVDDSQIAVIDEFIRQRLEFESHK